jgi:predicted metalloprotease
MNFRVYAILFIAAGTLCAQPDRTREQVHDFLRMMDTGVSDADVVRVDKNAEGIKKYLERVWYWSLLPYGRKYDPPFVVDGGKARNARLTWRCGNGKMAVLDNAFYCPASNSISYDGYFLAGLNKKTGKITGTPGDFAAIVALAHESGHALQYQLGIMSTSVFPNEQNADCFAGAMAYELGLEHKLRSADLAEAKAAMRLLGDPAKAGPLANAHGDAEQRISAFMAGYTAGPKGCVPYKPTRPPWMPPR